ncbi:hypothetical protein [Haloglomus litoreum]|uniref:hypothetical protein n=1 Tax=Haloglomus litoreum TaxID=3034026 RepID=UPI0023E80DDE|nr:hypothetical protein [Haloglomus sp. DT116]
MAIGEWINLIRDLGFLSVGAGLLYFIAKSAITQYFDKQLQQYQTELEKEKIRFSDLHTKRGEVVGELFTKMVDFEEDMRSLVKPFQGTGEIPQHEKIKQAADSGESFREYYEKNRVYLPPDVCETTEEMLGEFKEVFDDFAIYRVHEQGTSAFDPIERMDVWVEDWEKIDDDTVPELKRELENHFRELLGVELRQGSDQDT